MLKTTFFKIRLRIIAGYTAIIFAFLLNSCTSLLTGTVIQPAVGNLQKQSDVELVCEGSAAYLLMIDSLIESNPNNRDLLLIGTKAYSGSAAALISCDASPERIAAISEKAKLYGQRLLNPLLPIKMVSRPEFTEALNVLNKNDADYIFWGAFGWLTWVTQQQGSPSSMVDLVAIEKIMDRLLRLDESIENGSPHLFFGALYGSKPQMLGGDSERSRKHFEQALVLSDRSFLLVQTTFAETYCRMTFNKEMHDALLEEVINFPLEQAPENTLSNQIAKRKAVALLEEDFFGE